MGKAFSRQVSRLNTIHGKTYQEMASDCDFARSVTWFNKMRWEEIENPPEPGLFPAMAKALQVSERRVAEMVAEQWCGVRPDDTVPERLRSLVAVLRGVGVDDLPVIEQMAQALSDKATAEFDVERLSEKVTELEDGEEPYARENLEGLQLGELQAIVVRSGHGLAVCEGKDEAALVDLILEAGD
ncbi:hypothetical protein ACFCW6_13700 [Streptomyces sp. NPDC056333]|uniref:hypothetical protein n=1 Tax=Streptomyces sp. NPDC056333 TaxID=3345786 RepID=UPI0035DD7841